MDLVTLSLARNKAKQYTDAAIGNLPKGVVYKGSVNYYVDLPNNAELGDCYTVLYKETAGTEPSGIEYVWGVNTATGINEWTAFGPDLSEYATIDYVNNIIGDLETILQTLDTGSGV